MSPAPLVLGTSIPAVGSLASAVGGELVAVDVPVPSAADGTAWPWADALEAWRTDVAAGDRVDAVVVAAWTDHDDPSPLAGTDLAAWIRRSEVALAVWATCLGAAVARCADGGTVVAVTERAAPLDCAGWSAETGTADAVEALVRSLARSEGKRGVRVNGVTTPARLTVPPVVDPAPSLASFPGAIDAEVAGAVRMLLADGAGGVTGTIVNADCGRSWR